ncbi:MAG: hypothetical protein FJ260_05695 [Planctomycetes bacterium]|nr:hypothetical protein [Planctomycetota bacterium]
MGLTNRRFLALSFVLCALLAAPARAQWGSGDDGVAPPVTSAQLDALLAKLEADETFRAAAGKAMDAYVKRWQALRDGELRDATQAKRAAEAAAQAAQNDQQQSGAQDLRAYSAAIERLGRAQAQVREAEATLFNALREAAPEAAKPALEDAAMLRRRRAAAEVLGLVWSAPLRLPRVPDDLLADPQVRKSVHDRVRAWSKAATEELEREARVRTGTGTPEEAARDLELTQRVGEDIDWTDIDPSRIYQRSQLAAVTEIAKLLPESGRESWLRSARHALAAWVINIYPMPVPSARVRQEIGDRMSAEGQARFDRWVTERAALDQRILDTGDWTERAEIGEQYKGLDAAALADLAKSTGTEAIGQPDYSEKVSREEAFGNAGAPAAESLEADADEDRASRFASYGGATGTMERIRSRTAASLGEDASEESAPAERLGGEESMQQVMALRSLRHAETVAIRDRLGIPEAQQGLWDTMANDVLAQTEAARAEASEAYGKIMQGGDAKVGTDALAARKRFMAGAAAAEDRWFDAVAAAFPAVAKPAIDAERGRRALRRTIESSAMLLMLSRYGGNRWIDVDLDLATDRLSPAARQKAAPALGDWRLRKIASIDAIVGLAERLMERMMEMSNASAQAEDSMAKYQEAMARYKRDSDECARRARAEQASDLETVAGALGDRDGAAFRRAVRRQSYPEIYRAQDAAESAFDRAMADESVPAERKVEIADAWDKLTTGFDPIATRLIKGSEASEEAMGNMMGGTPDEAMMERMADASRKAAELSAAEYDANELRAHAARRLREINGAAAR